MSTEIERCHVCYAERCGDRTVACDNPDCPMRFCEDCEERFTEERPRSNDDSSLCVSCYHVRNGDEALESIRPGLDCPRCGVEFGTDRGQCRKARNAEICLDCAILLEFGDELAEYEP